MKTIHFNREMKSFLSQSPRPYQLKSFEAAFQASGLTSWIEQYLRLNIFSHTNDSLILSALTHSSFFHEIEGWPWGPYERLEFLGDAYLDQFISRQLYLQYPAWDEGKLSRMRSSLVNEEGLYLWGQSLGFANYILLGEGELSKEKIQPAIIADVFEALIGALSLIEGLDLDALLFFWIEVFENSDFETYSSFFDEGKLELFDPKSRLQEKTLKLLQETPEYTTNEISPGLFESVVKIKGRVVVKGKGSSKKKAEVEAARSLLTHNKVNFNEL